MTVAQQISKQLGYDGQRFENHDGVSLDDLAAEENVSVSWRDGYQVGDTVRYLFDDGSAITVSGDAWDYGYANCYCWQSVGHSEECLADRNWIDSLGDNDWYDTLPEAVASLCHFCGERTDERVLILVRRDEQNQKSYRPAHLSCGSKPWQ